MSAYAHLKSRIDNGEVVMLDGAVGTQLQDMGVPMHPVAWCAPANYTHPDTVELMHERYIRAGAEVITTNTFSTVRPRLEGAGYGDKVQEINIRAVRLAQQARDRAASSDRPVYIAGSLAGHTITHDPRSGVVNSGSSTARYTAAEFRAYAAEKADIMAEAGVDLFLIELMGADNEVRIILTEAARNTGLPVWVAFTSYVDPITGEVSAKHPFSRLPSPLNIEVRQIDFSLSLVDAIRQVAPLEPDLMAIFHSRLSDTIAGLEVLAKEWPGPLGVYPDAGRRDYTAAWQDRRASNEESVEEFTRDAARWVDMGAQVVGACCGFGVDYVRPLPAMLPPRIEGTRAA